MNREDLRHQIRQRLDGRQLIFFGTRGDDAEGIGDLPELAAVFSIIGSPRRGLQVQSLSLEELTGSRVDLDAHDIDDEPRSSGVVELRRAILRALCRDSVVFTYRPSTFLSAICFARQDRCTYAGMFKDHQSAFEHKPWVESSVRQLGIRSIPWTYIADDDQLETLRYLSDGPVVLRRSRSSGGAGIVRVESGVDLERLWPRQEEIFASVAQYIEGGIPSNVGGVVWHDGVTLHPPSVQLIGISECTTRPFGYCGNDFSAIQELSRQAIEEMETASRRIGEWLRSLGFLGAFGVDFLVDENGPLFTEVNPRLQGVTHLSCQLSASRGESCIMLEHLGALLGIDAPKSAPLVEQVANSPRLSHFVIHWPQALAGTANMDRVTEALLALPSVSRLDVTCPAGVELEPGATVCRVTTQDRITTDGFDFAQPWRSAVSLLIETQLQGAA